VAKQTKGAVSPDVTSRISQRRLSAQRNGKADYSAKRAEIITAAAEVFREKGYQAATLNDVAERLGTDRASLYYYVADKQELFHESVKGVLDDNLAKAEELHASSLPPLEKLSSLVSLVLESYEANHPQMFVYIQEDMAQIAKDESSWATEMLKKTRRMDRIFLSVIEEAVESGVFRDDISPRVATYALFGMMNWTHRWFEPGKRLKSSDLAEMFSAIFGEGMRKPS
jgi:AcrR family transcriptional regulator